MGSSVTPVQLLSCLLLITAILVVGCASPSPLTGSAPSSGTVALTSPVDADEPSPDAVTAAAAALADKMPVEIGSDRAYRTLGEALQKATFVVIGTVISRGQVVNGSRDVNDPSKPAPKAYVIAQLYRVKVESYLKGAGHSEIWVRQLEGRLPEDVPPTLVNIRAVQSLDKHVVMADGNRYLFLLSQMMVVPEANDLETYGQNAMSPRRFLLKPDGTAVIEELNPEIVAAYQARPIDQLIVETEAAIAKQ